MTRNGATVTITEAEDGDGKNITEKSLSLLRGSLVITTKSLIYFTFSTMALKASGLFMARSASTLRLISIPASVSLPMRTE